MSDPTPGRRREPTQRRSSDKVVAILSAARRLLARDDRPPSPRELAAEAGVSIGTLYRYFADVEAVIDELVVEHARHAEEAIAEVLDRGGHGSFGELLRAVLDRYVELYREHPRYMTLLADPELARRSADVEARSDESIVDAVIAAGIDQGVLNEAPAIAARRLRVHWLACGAVLGAAFRADPRGDPAMLAELTAMADLLAGAYR